MPAKLERCVTKAKRSMTKKYKDKTGKAPGKRKKQQISQSAYRICTAEGQEQGWT